MNGFRTKSHQHNRTEIGCADCLEIAPGEVHIWRIALDQPAHGLLDLLSPEETARSERLIHASEQNRFVRAHGALRFILGGYLGLSGEVLRFEAGDKGKPHLIGPDSGLEFNLSHSDDMALVAVTDNIPVGIDLERISSKPLQLKIAKRMFPESVYAELSALPPEQLGGGFVRYWTEFEARAKCLGKGIFTQGVEQGQPQIAHFTPEPGWIACVAVMQQATASLNLRHHIFGG